MVAPRESSELAARLISSTCKKQKIQPGQLGLHADRGAAMRSKPVGLLLADLSVTKTHIDERSESGDFGFKPKGHRPDRRRCPAWCPSPRRRPRRQSHPLPPATADKRLTELREYLLRISLPSGDENLRLVTGLQHWNKASRPEFSESPSTHSGNRNLP